MLPTHARTLVFFLVAAFSATVLVSVTPASAQDLPGPTYRVTGSVTTSNAALAGAAVSLLNAAGTSVGEATSDAAGNYAFSGVSAGTYSVSASEACCFRKSAEVRVGGLETNVQAPTLVLTKKEKLAGNDPVLLQGVVKDKSSGKALAGAVVEIQSYYGSDCADGLCRMVAGAQYFTIETDAQGRFELQVNRGHAFLNAYRHGYDRTYGNVNASKDTSVEVPMRAADTNMATLKGVVKDKAGAPVPGAYVHASPDYGYGDCGRGQVCDAVAPASIRPTQEGGWTFEPSQPTYNSTQAQDDGSWSMQIAPGTVRVVASAYEHLEQNQRVQATAGQTTTVDFALEKLPPDSVIVRGRVMDGAKPIPGAQVNVENQKWGTHAYGITDSEGRYEIRTKPGFSVIGAARYGGMTCAAAEPAYAPEDPGKSSMVAPQPCVPEENPKEYMSAVRTFEAVDGEPITIDFALKARPEPQSEFRGYVLNGTKAVPGAVVTFYNEVTRDWGQAATDEHGSYRIAVRGGYYTVRVWAPGFFDGAFNTEIGEKETKRLDVQLTPGEKRYGYYPAYYGGKAEVAVMDSAAAPGGAGGRAAGPSMPSGGEQAFFGEGGGLGPYKPGSVNGGNASSLAAFAALVALAGVAVLRRR